MWPNLWSLLTTSTSSARSPSSHHSGPWRALVTVYSMKCTVYSEQSRLNSVQFAVYSEQCTLYTVQWTVVSVQPTAETTSRTFSILTEAPALRLHSTPSLTNAGLSNTLWVFDYDSSSLDLPARFCCKWCIVQGVPCVLYKACSVSCTRCVVCIK